MSEDGSRCRVGNYAVGNTRIAAPDPKNLDAHHKGIRQVQQSPERTLGSCFSGKGGELLGTMTLESSAALGAAAAHRSFLRSSWMKALLEVL